MIDEAVFKSYLKACTLCKKPFKIVVSNYSYKIQSDLINFNSIHEQKTLRFFAASSKVKKDCLLKPLPVINKKDIKYFQFDIKEELSYEKIYGIDLKNAYASILLNSGYITKETFNYLSTLPKLERLGSLGMLAGKKKEIIFDENGNYKSSDIKIKETENYFFFAVSMVGKIMDACKELIGDDFLFIWVDCIYFKSEESINIISEFLKDNFLNFHEKRYEKFTTKKVSEKAIKIVMSEISEEGKRKLKMFHAPTKKKKIIDELSYLIDKFS
jgi:hypothetical protein